MAYPNPVTPQPLTAPSQRPVSLGLLMEYPSAEAEAVALGEYLDAGSMLATVYPGSRVWVEDCAAPMPTLPGVAWDNGRILAWDAGLSLWDADSCLPVQVVPGGSAGRFAPLPGLSTLEFEWHDLAWFFWFDPPGAVVDSVNPPPPEPEWKAPCPPPIAAIDCHPPECFVPWDGGVTAWDGGLTWWQCEEG